MPYNRTASIAAAFALITASTTIAAAPSPSVAVSTDQGVLKLHTVSADLRNLFIDRQGRVDKPILVGGLGSSVGVGATLTDSADTPVSWFARDLARTVPSAKLAGVRVLNDSVNGSTVHDGRYRDWAVLRRSRPDVVVLAYGMNDGARAQFSAGETYSGAMQDLRRLISDVRKSGAVPVILTSPSAHTTRENWEMDVGPEVAQRAPVDTSAPIRVVTTAHGEAVESTRHAAVNAGFRQVARELDADLIDVEPYWLDAVATRGQDALFNAGEFAHPNLLGHRLSYHAAIDAWFTKHQWATPRDLLPAGHP